METISIMSKNGKKLTFNYFDSSEYVYKKLCDKYDCSFAITVLNQFENMKKRIYNKAYLNYLEKVRKDNKLGIVEILMCNDGSRIYINIYDSEDTIFRKYEKMLSRHVNENEKKQILERYDSIVKSMIEENIFESMRKVNNGRKI